MGAPRRWIKQLLGLKKSAKIVSSDEEEKNSKRDVKNRHQNKNSVEVDKGVIENEVHENVDTDFEDANWQWDLDQSSASLQAKNAAQLPQDRGEELDAKDGNFQSDDMSASPQEQNVAQLQQGEREENMGVTYAKETNFQSAADSPTSPEVESAGQLEQDMGEGWATPDVREIFDSDPNPSSSPSSSPQGQYAALLQESDREELVAIDPVKLDRNMQEGFAARCIQTVMRRFLRHNGAKTRLPMSEESAAICIQTVYRGFLAKRALRGLKGLMRLQAQMKGRTVKRQTAIALRCIQALVKVQVRSRAKHVLVAIEGQAVQQKLLQQLEHEAPVKKPEVSRQTFTYNGWCNEVGSAGEVQARMLKRKEAAAKREKTKAYALARQWQAGIRHQPQQQQQPQQHQEQASPAGFPTTAGFPSEKCEWTWNWLERWMAVRPWETQILGDASLRDGMKSPKSELGVAMDVPLFSTGNGKVSPRLSNIINMSKDGCFPSPRKLSNAQESPKTPVSSKSPRTSVQNAVREATSRPTIGPRSSSTPRERSALSDNQDKKRLSLPGTVHGARLIAQTGNNSPRTQSPRTQSPHVLSPRTPQKPGNTRTKLNGNEVKTSKLSR